MRPRSRPNPPGRCQSSPTSASRQRQRQRTGVRERHATRLPACVRGQRDTVNPLFGTAPIRPDRSFCLLLSPSPSSPPWPMPSHLAVAARAATASPSSPLACPRASSRRRASSSRRTEARTGCLPVNAAVFNLGHPRLPPVDSALPGPPRASRAFLQERCELTIISPLLPLAFACSSSVPHLHRSSPPHGHVEHPFVFYKFEMGDDQTPSTKTMLIGST